METARPAPPQTCETANLIARGSDDSGAEGKRQTEGMLEAPALRLKIDKKGDKIRYFSRNLREICVILFALKKENSNLKLIFYVGTLDEDDM